MSGKKTWKLKIFNSLSRMVGISVLILLLSIAIALSSSTFISPTFLNISDIYVNNITMRENINMSGNNLTNVDTILGDGDNVKIGAGADSHSLTSPNDLFVGGRFEIDGMVYADGDAMINDARNLYFGASNDTAIQYDTSQTNDALIIGVGAGSEAVLIIQKSDIGYDFTHPEQLNPTLFIHSKTQTDDEWISLSHDTVNGIIDSGTNTTEIASKAEFNDNVYVGANLSVADSISDLDLYSVESNGSNIVIESFQSLPIVIKTFSENGTAYLCSVNDSGSFICS